MLNETKLDLMPEYLQIKNDKYESLVINKQNKYMEKWFRIILSICLSFIFIVIFGISISELNNCSFLLDGGIIILDILFLITIIHLINTGAFYSNFYKQKIDLILVVLIFITCIIISIGLFNNDCNSLPMIFIGSMSTILGCLIFYWGIVYIFYLIIKRIGCFNKCLD